MNLELIYDSEKDSGSPIDILTKIKTNFRPEDRIQIIKYGKDGSLYIQEGWYIETFFDRESCPSVAYHVDGIRKIRARLVLANDEKGLKVLKVD